MLTDENSTLSGTVKNLTDELCKRDKFIEELQSKITELENSTGKKLFGFTQKKN